MTKEMIEKIVSKYRTPEYKTILREPLEPKDLCPPSLTGFKAPYPVQQKGTPNSE
jgi:hypothetical protein